MTANPFHRQVDDALVGRKVRVHTETTVYEEWLQIREYNDPAVLLVDAVRDDDTHVGEVVVHDITAIERCEPETTIERVAIDCLRPSPYSQRSFETADFRTFVRTVRERGHLHTFPLVRPVDEGDFEIVSGHKRYEAARQAGLETIAARIATLDDWDATTIFLDEHVPMGPEEAAEASDPYAGLYDQAELAAAVAVLREDWTDEQLRDHPALAWYFDTEQPYPAAEDNEDAETDESDE